PGETPSTGSDVATVSTEGVEFPFPEYLQNIVAQVLRRWQRPLQGSPLEAEVSFFVHRDGSVTGLQFVRRSGDFEFDLEAQSAVEEAGRFKVFGALPAGWNSDVLFVRFHFIEPPHTPGEIFMEALVDEKPAMLSSPTLQFPELLRQAGISGRVLVQAIVDTLGRVEPNSVKVLQSPNPGFDQSARNYALNALFRPARMHGRAVRVLIQIPIDFRLKQ
ncbi:MAG TPA: energy transducer TonB, partial [Gemmatimonadales bacterium]|nr:energy transducer TonB [Gemmatimonadales bacterium]